MQILSNDATIVKKRKKAMKIKTLDDALIRIKELETEIAELKAENEKLKSRNFGGRKKHDAAWTAAYNDFILKYESGKTLVEIVAEGDISRRTAYRYLEYYKKFHKMAKGGDCS